MAQGLSRRAVLAGAAAAPLTLTGSSVSVARDVTRGLGVPSSQWLDSFIGATVTAKDAGANRDSADNQPVLQRAIDWLSSQPTPGRLTFDEGIWRLGRPLRLRSNVLIEGVGAASVLRSTVQASNPNACDALIVGSMRAAGTPLRPQQNIMALDALALVPGSLGDRYVNLATSAAGSGLGVGQVVFIWSREGAVKSGWRFYQQMNRVVGLLGARIDLAYPLYADMHGLTPMISFTGGRPTPGLGSDDEVASVADRCGVRHMGLHSENGRAFHFSGVFESRFEDITILRSSHLFGGSAMAYCAADRIVGQAREQAINTAYFSHNRNITNVTCRWDGRPGVRKNAGILFEENCHDTFTGNVSIDAGDSPNIVTAIRFAKSASNNVVENVEFKSTGAGSGAAVEFIYNESGPQGGNVVRGLTVTRGRGRGADIMVAAKAPSRFAPLGLDRIEDSNFTSGDGSTPALRFDGGDVQLSNVRTTGGLIQVGRNARNVDVDGWRPQRPMEVRDLSGGASNLRTTSQR